MTVAELIQKLLDYENQSHNTYIRCPECRELLEATARLQVVEDAGTADIYPYGDDR